MKYNYKTLNNSNKTNDNFNIKLFFQNYKKNILIIIICSFFYSFGQVQFLIKSASVSDGIEAISTTLSYVFPILKPFLTVFYLLLNIPFLIFFWNKIKKDFLILTIIFLTFNAIFGFILSIEEIDNFIKNKLIVIIPNGNDFISPNSQTTIIVEKGWPVFIYVMLAVVFCSPASAFIWKNGASTGGTDIIAHYISVKKKKDIGFLLLIIGTLMATIGIITIILLKTFAGDSIKNNINGYFKIINTQAISSFVYIFLNAFIINWLYSKYAKVKIKIDISDYQKINTIFEDLNYWHSYKITQNTSGYTKQTIYTIETIVLLLEAEYIIKEIKKINSNAWISVIPVKKIFGKFNYSSIE